MDFSSLSNAELLQRLRELATRERGAKADFMACMAEVDRRENVFCGSGYTSLYDFCVRDLKLSESSAYQRVKLARLVRSRSDALSYLRDGSVHLTTLSMITPHAEEHPDLVEKIKGKSRREVEALLAAMVPGRNIPDRIKLLPAVSQAARVPDLFDTPPAAAQTKPAKPMPTPQSEQAAPKPAELRAELRFAAGERFVEVLEKLKAVLWHKHPSGRLEDVLLTAMEEYLKRHDPARDVRHTAACVPPADPRSRKVPPALRRRVWRRDEGRCAYVGTSGRCAERKGLEVDHIVPWALGGPSNDLSNLRLLCRAHNQSERQRIFGSRV